MGMFDDLNCKYPLPNPEHNDLDFQTKDTPSQFLNLYEIREDGTLWEELYDIEDQSDPDAEGIARCFGMMARVNYRWSKVESFDGKIDFYTDVGEDWVEYSANFVNGALQTLTIVEELR